MEMMNGLQVSDEILGTFAPIILYWIYSGMYELLGSLDNYRLHSRKDEDEKNLVSKKDVVKGVLLQQAVQAVVATILFAVTGSDTDPLRKRADFILCSQPTTIGGNDGTRHLAIFHAPVHASKQVLVPPYPFPTPPSSCTLRFRSVVQSPGGRFALDTCGGALAFLVSGMSPRASIFFFSFGTLKTVDDHCGLWLPGNPFHIFFNNNSAYHDVHHQLYGNKYNFSQPFFVMWDWILGTYMPYSLEKRSNGGFSTAG